MLAEILLLAQAASAPAPMPAFLTGCWEQQSADRWTEECWTSARGEAMIGSARDGKRGEVGHWEWMRIERSADGSLTFYASPKGAVPVAFKASAADARSVTFVNGGHDFPQRVRYERTSDGLEAEISLADGSKPVRWSFKRAANPGD